MLIRDAINESKVSNYVYEAANGQEAIEFLLRRGEWANAPARVSSISTSKCPA